MKDSFQNIAFDFSTQRFVVTGASSGIGRRIALELASSGAEVLAIARRENELKEVQGFFPERIHTAAIDITDFGMLRSNIEKFIESGKVSGSVHAAGISKFTPLSTFKKSEAEELMAINLWAGVELVRLLSRRKYIEKNVSHVLISSAGGLKGERGLLDYAATKSALITVARTMALEVASLGIRVNTVSPGVVNTQMVETMRTTTLQKKNSSVEQKHILGIGESRDVASAVLFLLSDGARWITGSNIVVDGGYLA